MTSRTEILGRPNRFVIGGSFDGGETRFNASSEVGALTLDREFAEPGIVVSQPDGSITPVDMKATNAYYGPYISDVLDVTDRLSATVSGRLNVARLTLRDQIGTEINGDHRYIRLNPAGGLAYKITPDVSIYGGYSEANRTPTPAELSCADPASPCSLTNFFVGDPPLKQIVAGTVEAGLRGQFRPFEATTANWYLGAFRTETGERHPVHVERDHRTGALSEHRRDAPAGNRGRHQRAGAPMVRLHRLRVSRRDVPLRLHPQQPGEPVRRRRWAYLRAANPALAKANAEARSGSRRCAARYLAPMIGMASRAVAARLRARRCVSARWRMVAEDRAAGHGTPRALSASSSPALGIGRG